MTLINAKLDQNIGANLLHYNHKFDNYKLKNNKVKKINQFPKINS